MVLQEAATPEHDRAEAAGRVSQMSQEQRGLPG